MFGALRFRINLALRRTAFGAAGALCFLLGLGFLTSAVWIGLALAYGGLIASLLLGLIYCGLGLVLVAFAARRPPSPSPAPAAAARPVPTVGQADLIAAFLGGLDTGRAMARRSRRRPDV